MMGQNAFDQTSARTAEAKALWGNTAAYKEYEAKTAGQSPAEQQTAGDGLVQILSVFGKYKGRDVADPAVQQQVKALQDYITAHFYTCTDEILAGLGALYAAGGAFTENIDRAGGAGTAQYVQRAIAQYCASGRKPL